MGWINPSKRATPLTELEILTALHHTTWQCGQDTYNLAIRARGLKSGLLTPPLRSVYPILQDLVKNGFAQQRDGEEEPDTGWRPRHEYVLTVLGRRRRVQLQNWSSSVGRLSNAMIHIAWRFALGNLRDHQRIFLCSRV
jgi:DNA-binding PadR family transcriptional regulator